MLFTKVFFFEIGLILAMSVSALQVCFWQIVIMLNIFKNINIYYNNVITYIAQFFEYLGNK